MQTMSHYKSDDMDDLLEGVITNSHKLKEDKKILGPIDLMVQDEVNKARMEVRNDPVI